PDPSRVANDDKETVGALLQALQARPSSRAYWLAALASLVWLGLTGAGVWQRYNLGAVGIEGAFGAIGAVEGALPALTVLGPVVLFFVLATLHTRAQEMRLVARAMTGVAVRLAQPENLAADSVVNLSQAVRREVAAMGDGLERALARAGELETLVRTEISTLERAYGDNEIRIRSLLDE